MIVMGPAPTTAIGSRYGNIVSSGLGLAFRFIIVPPFRLAKHFFLQMTRRVTLEVTR